MATEIKKRIGTVPCPVCGTICAVKINGRDTLNYVCHSGCDNPGWAKAGTEAHRIIMSRMTPLQADKPEPKPTPAAKPAPATQPRKAGFFA